jgi:murein DD-endopeptidase MepM/ murein hydrolase activator NlpD
MNGTPKGHQYTIAAAAPGTIRFIVDTNSEPTDNTNYVWIQHSNGEWTKYTHFETDSVTDKGWHVGDHVLAGSHLGFEGDVGKASGEHLHFEVAVPDDPANPIDSAGFIIGQNRIPLICDIPGNILIDGEIYTADHCS